MGGGGYYLVEFLGSHAEAPGRPPASHGGVGCWFGDTFVSVGGWCGLASSSSSSCWLAVLCLARSLHSAALSAAREAPVGWRCLFCRPPSRWLAVVEVLVRRPSCATGLARSLTHTRTHSRTLCSRGAMAGRGDGSAGGGCEAAAAAEAPPTPLTLTRRRCHSRSPPPPTVARSFVRSFASQAGSLTLTLTLPPGSLIERGERASTTVWLVSNLA